MVPHWFPSGCAPCFQAGFPVVQWFSSGPFLTLLTGFLAGTNDPHWFTSDPLVVPNLRTSGSFSFGYSVVIKGFLTNCSVFSLSSLVSHCFFSGSLTCCLLPDIAVLVLVFNAAQWCPSMPALFSDHTFRHYAYLRDSLSHLVPPLRVRHWKLLFFSWSSCNNWCYWVGCWN